MKHIQALLLLSLLLLVSAGNIYSQKNDNTELRDKYKQAKTLFDEGKADKALDVLRPHLRKIKQKNASKELRAKLNRMAALSHIILKNEDSALIYVKHLLSIYPDYVEKNKEDYDFQRLHSFMGRYTTHPGLIVGFVAGINTCRPFEPPVESSYSLFDGEGNTEIDYKVGGGYYYGIAVENFFTQRFSATASINISKMGYTLQTNNETMGKFTDKQSFSNIELPLFIKYSLFSRWGTQINVEIGGAVSVLSKAVRSETENTNGMYKLNWGEGLGFGISHSFGKFMIAVDAKYIVWNRQVNNPDSRFLFNDNSDIFIHKFYDIADDIKIRNAQFEIKGYYTLNYNVQKK